MECWSCHTPEPGTEPFCQACGAIQPPRGADPFAVVGLPERFALDETDLEARYKAWSRKLHPDRFAKADPRARRYSLARATELNDAYKILRSPTRRAEHLLRGRGIDVTDESTGSKYADPALLMEVMEEREALAEARAQGDQGALARMEAAMRKRREAALAQVAEGFSEQEDEKVARALIALRYCDRFLEELEAQQGGFVRRTGNG